MIFSMLCFNSNTPISTTANAMINAAMYSYLACPNGCSLSAGLLESLNPKTVTTDDAASDRLLIASATIATEPENTPTRILKMHNITLEIIPKIPATIP